MYLSLEKRKRARRASFEVVSRPRRKDGPAGVKANPSVESRGTPERKKEKKKKRGSERRMYEESTGDKRHKPRQVLDSSRVSLFVVPFKFSSARHGSFSSLLSPCRMLKDHGERNIKETREAGEVENTQHNAEMDGGRLGLSYSRAKIYSRVTRSDRKCRQHATI